MNRRHYPPIEPYDDGMLDVVDGRWSNCTSRQPGRVTVSFGVDGALYTIDLNKKSAAALRKALAEFVYHARRVTAIKGGGSRRAGKRPVPRSGPEPAVVREWAAAQGITVSTRGWIPADVVTQYEAAHP